MTRYHLTQEVTTLIAKTLGVRLAEVHPHASLTEDLGADSLDFPDLLMAFEEAFDIQIDDKEAERYADPDTTVKNVIDALAALEAVAAW